ncbi:Copia protein [Linum perenne]
MLHHRLGHPSFLYLKHLFPNIFNNVKLSDLRCDSCQFAKIQRTTFGSQNYKPSRPFYLIHSDVWGPSRIPSRSGQRWFVTFIDDHTRVSWVFLLKHKSEVAQTFKMFYHYVQNQFQTQISILRSDNGTEYFNDSFKTFSQTIGLVQQSSCSNTPQQNGIAERKNRHLLEVTRALMFSANVPKYFWGDALLTATYLINRMPSKVLNFKTPLNGLLDVFPSHRLSTDLPLKIFGCICFTYIPAQFRSKLDHRSQKCIFLGYSATKKGYLCFEPTIRKLYTSMDVVFWENQPFYSPTSLQGENSSSKGNFWELDRILPSPIPPNLPSPIPPNQLPEPEDRELVNENEELGEPDIQVVNTEMSTTGGEMQDMGHKNPTRELQVYHRRKTAPSTSVPDIQHTDDQPHSPGENPLPENEALNPTVSNPTHVSSSIDTDSNWPIALRKGTRSCTRYPIDKYLSYARLSNHHRAFVTNVSNLFVPRNIYEALGDANWSSAVNEEMHALITNQTWKVVDLPAGKSVVGCKWVFTIKCKADGSVERYKARLVAKGFTQTHGVDYTETFAPVAKMNSVRILLSVAVNLDWPLYQLDVKNAFLNGTLDEEVYMSLPPGFEKQLGAGSSNGVCYLQKSLYGLKQSPRAWFERFGKAIARFGYTQSQTDHTMFFKHFDHGKMVVLIVYVDDIIVTGNDAGRIQELKNKLAQEFEIKDLGVLKYFLGMEFARSKEGLFINQRKYILDMLEEVGLTNCKPIDTPMEPNLRLRPSSAEEVKDLGRYQKIVGKLIYLSHTRPDISFAVSMVSQFMHSPGPMHFEAVYRIIRYLKGTPGSGIMYKRREHLQIEAYTDADWAGDVNDRRSTTGYCAYVGGNLVSWRSKKQPVVARSSAEAEYRALALGITEVTWIGRLLQELKVTVPKPIRIYCDNKAAVAIAHNPVLHDRTKHVEIDKYYIKENLDSGMICIPYIPTTDQVADIFTKGLFKGQFNYLKDKLTLENIFEPA